MGKMMTSSDVFFVLKILTLQVVSFLFHSISQELCPHMIVVFDSDFLGF